MSNFHSNVILDLGGKAKLADALGIDRVVLTKWHVRGIPLKYWRKVVDLGTAQDPPRTITFDDLERTKPLTTGAA